MKTVKVDNKTYAKTMAFGNRKMLTIFRNKKKYDRKKLKQYEHQS
jgi:hypothetical protein